MTHSYDHSTDIDLDDPCVLGVPMFRGQSAFETFT